MSRRHGWHLFDAATGMEARRTWWGWQVRDKDGTVTRLSEEEFAQLRAEGPNPKGLT